MGTRKSEIDFYGQKQQRPYLYGTVKQKQNGTLAFVNWDRDDYFTVHGGEFRQVQFYNPNSFWGYDFKNVFFSNVSVTEKGYADYVLQELGLLIDWNKLEKFNPGKNNVYSAKGSEVSEQDFKAWYGL